jgi:hypothetical protein
MQTQAIVIRAGWIARDRYREKRRDRPRLRFFRALATAELIALIWVLLAAPGAMAGMVTASVHYDQGAVPAGTVLTIRNDGKEQRLRVQKEGEFQVFLEPGLYRVECSLAGADWEAWFQSFRHNTRQTVTLKKKGR